ncbi:MAG: mandelate racemase/muconate lactonizing enzyme family protein, partial [Bryobacteraceae bacterium]|nr:mandelate racemase/muconate lactonizing enzyme family protein [Bryobacteraceae bacterium]
FLFVEIETDAGLKGLGEGSLPGRVDIVEQAVKWLEPHLVGQDPGGIEDHWSRLYYQASRWRDGSVMNTALAAVDIALWDLEGQRLGVPVWRLLGAREARPLKVYYSHWSQEVNPRTPEGLAALAVETKAAGWEAVKWITFRGGEEAERRRRIVKEVEAVRKAAGEDFGIALELAETFTARTAIELARALEPYGLLFLEEPTWRESPQTLGEVAAATRIPIATGEGLVSRYEYRTLLEAKGARVVQPDVIHCGGISEIRRIAMVAEMYGAEVAPHMWYGPVAHVASLHAMTPVRNFWMQEWDAVHDRIFAELVEGEYPVQKKGRIAAPAGAGLGIRMKWSEWERRCAYQGPSRRPPTGR